MIGATGVIGKVLMNALIHSRNYFDDIGIFTSPETLTLKKALIDSYRENGVHVIIGDLYSDDDVLEAYKGPYVKPCRSLDPLSPVLNCLTEFDTIVSAVGRFGIDKQVDLITLAERSNSIVRFIPSEYGTDVAYNETSATEKTHQKKLKVRAHLESSLVQHVKYTYLVTGPFADLYVGCMEGEPQLGSFDTQKREATLLGDGNGSVSLTTMADVGRCLVGILKNPAVCDNRAIKVNSFTTTPNEILAEFERQTSCMWNVKYTPLAALRTVEGEAWENGNPLASLYTLRRIWTEGGTLYDKRDNESVGLSKMDTLEMVVQAAILSPTAAFQSGKM